MNHHQKLVFALLLIGLFILTAAQGIRLLRQESGILGINTENSASIPCAEIERLNQLYCFGK